VVKLMLMVLRKPLNVPLPTVDDCAALRFIAYERATALVLVSASEVVLGIRW
jgi:energy-converting hydrogenase Eha subunit E